MSIIVNLDVVMAQRKISSRELARRIGITPANLSILKSNRAKAIRFSTLQALCHELQCQPGDLLAFCEDPQEPSADIGESTDRKEQTDGK